MSLDCLVLLFGQLLLLSFNLARPSRPGPMTGDGRVLQVDTVLFLGPLKIRSWFQEGHVVRGEPIGILPSPTKKVLNSLVMTQDVWKREVAKHHGCHLMETAGRVRAARRQRAEGEKEI